MSQQETNPFLDAHIEAYKIQKVQKDEYDLLASQYNALRPPSQYSLGSWYGVGSSNLGMGGSPYSGNPPAPFGPTIEQRIARIEEQFSKIGPYLTRIAEAYEAMEIEERDDDD